MKRTDELSATSVSAITVDGYKPVGEWDENWFYGQDNASDYNASGPFGDRLVIRQGVYKFPIVVTDAWCDTDPQEYGRNKVIDLKDLLDEYDNLNVKCSEYFEYFYDSNCDDSGPCSDCDNDDYDKNRDDKDDSC